ncbi:hypothetical protein VNO77_09530 [Canavalia gladiata]|uniref:Uncharacterized protein n=1 Tax=Canavalia gladiata TaxID=3824 RepID=A0AAN9MA26_CANGL
MLALMASSRTAWPRAVIIVILVLALISCIPATATASTVEHCLKLRLNPPPSPPRGSGYHSALDLSRIVCRDVFRVMAYSLRSTGKLPFSYLFALCEIFDDNEPKVESYIIHTFRPYNFHRLVAGRSCASIRNKQHAPSPSPLPRL